MFESKKILIIDDSLMDRDILKNIVNVLGFLVIEAENGEDGIKMALEYHPDIILMDVIMPGINGFQATKNIMNNEVLKKIPIIMCTCRDKDVDRIWAIKQGAKAYIKKPINKNELLNEIKNLLS